MSNEMTLFLVLLLFTSTFFLATFAWWAVTTAKSTLRQATQLLNSSSARSLKQLDSEVASLELSYASLSQTVKSLRSRIGMQDLRARRAQESAPESETPPPDPQARKAWLRQQLQKGKLRIVRDGAGAAAEKATGAGAAAE